MEQYYLIVFENTSSTMRAESQLKELGIKIRIMPTPTYITKSCGISIRVENSDGENVRDILKLGEIRFKGYYAKEKDQINQIL